MHACRVRHEAGEALGAIGSAQCLQLLRVHQTDPCLEVAQTCQLALQRIQHYAAASSSVPVPQPSASRDAPATCAASRDDGVHGSHGGCEPAGVSARNDATMPGDSAHAAKAAYAQAHGRGLPACHGAALPQQCHQPAGAPLPEPDEASPYLSVDPAPAAPLSTPTPALRVLLLDEAAPIFDRYRCSLQDARACPCRHQSICARGEWM